MIKYLLVGFLLLTGLAGHAPAAALQPGLINVSAHFETASRGVMTRVDIRLQHHAGVAAIGLVLRQDRQHCRGVVCQEAPVISAYAWQDLPVSDALLARSRAAASAHVALPVHDDIANAVFSVRVDVVWIGAGPTRCGVVEDTMGCLRPANVTGFVTLGPRVLIADQTATDGWIKWREWPMPTRSGSDR